MDSKLGVISIGDQPPWNSIGVPPSLVFCYMSRNKINLLMIKEGRYKTIYRASKPQLLIGFLLKTHTPNSNSKKQLLLPTTPTSTLRINLQTNPNHILT
ncbi:hypothetical protein GW17_00058966 [Ensete ventricosum]|nr:hypothetical protein GW17_00058966 [Ensete ventricosum]